MTTVLMFHSLGLEKSKWIMNYLSVPVSQVEALFRFFKSAGYSTIFLDEWYCLEDQPEKQNSKQVILTFDDGYLDNWVYLYPLLEKYGLKATLFINPEFIDPSDEPRPNLIDVWNNRIKEAELQAKGFLNWAEIQIMQQSGLVDIQSHSMSHNWYFSGSRVCDFYFPSKKELFWLPWLSRPERKPFYMTEDQRDCVETGFPVFENGRSLGIRRYFPDEELVNFSTELFKRNPDISMAQAKELCVALMTKNNSKGRKENDQEMVERYVYELKTSKEILESKLGKKVDYLCWPGGAYNDLSLSISKELGYRASTFSSRERGVVIDNSGPYKRIPRIGIDSSFTARGRVFIDGHPQTLVRRFKEIEGKWIWKIPRRAKKLFFILFK